ncbi:uncharacterized protein LOC141702153 [Apium graveolens]|uniref:uncharacterized protein LOC141702153 n=1 Tax=Apium graveolens TaxID=4045 RepID=UPI003D7BF167
MFAVASMGVQVDKLINNSRGPYVFRAGGQIYHNTSSLLPPTGKKPLFAQLYIYDTDHEISNRISTLRSPEKGPAIDENVIRGLTQMLDDHNPLVRSYRKARDMFEAQPETTFHLRLPEARTRDGRQYNIPTESEVGGLIVGELTEKIFKRDVIVRHRTKGVTHIDELHPSYMSMVYPLIHPYGEDGYRLGIPLADRSSQASKRQALSMCQYYCFRLQQRAHEGHTLLLAGRLLQQYIVDAYMAVEQERFRWIRTHQTELRTELYSGLMDAVHRGDSDSSTVGKSVVLPSSHTGGPRYRAQNYQDAMAICRWVGYPDLFITFTCNPKWPEINDMISLMGQKDDRNRVDIVCRVFEIKLQQLIHYIKKEQPFGKVMACLYTIEFQKRGLPHAHILLFLHTSMKNPSPEYIDTIISAEIPDINIDHDGYNAVKKSILHGPCGQANASSPCMQHGRCTKFFPKKFNDITAIGEDGFPIYRRRNTGISVEKKGTLLDNRYVIPYNRNLLVKFDAHINIELCNSARSIKYLFKYINKGPDRATAVVETTIERDEIKAYLDCRYISACEACWRIFQFNINYRYPSVERLPFHLPDEHTVIFDENKCIENVLNMPGIEKTKFTEWLKTNKRNEDARGLTYAEFPQHWVWNSKGKLWTRRKKGKAVGRIYFAHPASGERFYMRMLLNFVKGSTSFECIRTVDGVTYPTFKAACYALGLLDDDKEWIDCLSEAAVWATGNELRNLFVTILVFCQVSNVPELWKTHSEILSEDMLHLQRKRFHAPNLHLTKEQTESYALAEIESLMQKLGRSLRDIDGMSQPDTSLTQDLANRLLNEELDYDRAALKILHEKSLNALNYFQKSAYDAILHSVEHDEGKLFFVSGHGGTGKTFLWDTIASKLRSESLIVLPVATSGLASLLLPNGRTAHSRFRIPLDITAESTCEIKHGTQLAKLLQKTSLIIWDEAPMTHKYCFEALDKTLRDLLSTRYADSRTKPFGGLTVVCGGDFRQILPVIPQGERADIIDASLNSSYLWPHFKIFELKQNMRLHRVGVDEIQAEKITSFDRWLLQIGDGSLYDNPAQEMIKIPPELCRPTSKNSMEAIVAEVYPSLLENYKDPAYLKERAILTPKNETVYELNDFLMNMIPGEGRTYLSSDSVCKASIKADDDLLYPTEFLNSLRFSGVPNHDIRLQEGTPVMLLRNLNQSGGLCNGTRLIVTRLGKWSIRADIISGTKIGQNVTIPRIIMSPKESKWPFKLNRRQLPVAPCFAMTINKSQGQSLKRVGLYLPGQVFTHGQVYVALSRVTAIEGLVIVNSDNEVKDHSLIKNIVYKEVFNNVQPTTRD